MLLTQGHWVGKGSALVEGASLGETVVCDVKVEADSGGVSIHADWRHGETASQALTVRVAGNEVGTYSVNIRGQAGTLLGTAKLDSQPNLGLVWNEEQTVTATFALFPVAKGCGCRGFLRDGTTTYTWEIALSLRQDVVPADNVVSLRPRARR